MDRQGESRILVGDQKWEVGLFCQAFSTYHFHFHASGLTGFLQWPTLTPRFPYFQAPVHCLNRGTHDKTCSLGHNSCFYQEQWPLHLLWSLCGKSYFIQKDAFFSLLTSGCFRREKKEHTAIGKQHDSLDKSPLLWFIQPGLAWACDPEFKWIDEMYFRFHRRPNKSDKYFQIMAFGSRKTELA
jgi:hypothetical protein